MYYNSIYGNLLKELFLLFRRPFMSSKAIARYIFNIDLSLTHSRPVTEFYWDLTTLVLKKALAKHVKDNQRVLEVGTGEFAILSIYLAKKKKVDMTAVDINPVSLRHAEEVVKYNGVNVHLAESDIFSNVEGTFDIIFWNLPYVPTDFGKEYHMVGKNGITMEDAGSTGWDGGPAGTEFLDYALKDAHRMLNSCGKLIVGINTFFLTQRQIQELIAKSGLTINAVCSSVFNPSKAYILTK